MAEASVSERILTIPNVISIIRMALVPVFVWALFGAHDRYLAASILAVLGISDGIDGYIARHFNAVSRFGQVFDPIADRILLITALACVAIDASMPYWILAVVALRELSVIGLTAWATAAGLPRHEVVWFGKAGTFGLMMAIPFFLVAESTAGWADVAKIGGYITSAGAMVFGWIAVVIYWRRWCGDLRDLRRSAD